VRALAPGQIAGIDSEEGRSLNLTCTEGATLHVTGGHGLPRWMVPCADARVSGLAGVERQ